MRTAREQFSQRYTWSLVILLVALQIKLCAWAEERGAVLQVRRSWNFQESGVWFDNQFDGARLNACSALGPDEFVVTVSPENTPINPSPWYAFQVGAASPRTIRIHLTPTGDGRLLRARLSADGKRWALADRASFVTDTNTRVATLTLNVGPKKLWVAAQEIVGVAELEAWTQTKSALPFVHSSVIGASIEGRAIRQLTVSETTNLNYVFIIGRQHPPEVTGSIGLMSFVDALTARTHLAAQYRRQFQTVIVPLVNPDGVVHGHWRSNLGGVDLNRDWSAFNQPETAAITNLLLRLCAVPQSHPFVFMDFHSTGSNVFYAQPDGQAMSPFDFTRRWLDRTAQVMPDFKFGRDNGHNIGVATSKAWANATFNIPAITVEFGYSTDRAAIRKFAAAAAEQMMRLLIEELESSPAHAARIRTEVQLN